MVLSKQYSRFNGLIQVKWSLGLGKYIEVAGLTQSGWILEVIWKQVLRFLRKNHPNIQKVLILGLGGGSVVKPLMRIWPKANLTGVDIDEKMIQLGQRHFGLGKKPIRIVVADAVQYPFSKAKYDLVIVDLYHGRTFPKQFHTAPFLKKLALGKIVIINRLWKKSERTKSLNFKKRLQKYFAKVEVFYPLSNTMFICLKK